MTLPPVAHELKLRRKTHLEGEIGECVRNSGFGLVPTASLEQDGDAR